ncbi:MAG: hypothetical protein FD123_1134 [Bacteroidetes bacterium]|nr:MAG: hypothetical protein FD123_1134 [Bacteroidota bacterium]
MKKSIALVLLLTTSLPSCNKYPDGPSLSFRSKKSRLANSWQVQYYSENFVNKTDDFKNIFVNYNLIIGKDGNYSVSYKFLNSSDYLEMGNWTFDDPKKNVVFSRVSPSASTTSWIIMKLENDELWGRDIDTSGLVKEVHLIPR